MKRRQQCPLCRGAVFLLSIRAYSVLASVGLGVLRHCRLPCASGHFLLPSQVFKLGRRWWRTWQRKLSSQIWKVLSLSSSWRLTTWSTTFQSKRGDCVVSHHKGLKTSGEIYDPASPSKFWLLVPSSPHVSHSGSKDLVDISCSWEGESDWESLLETPWIFSFGFVWGSHHTTFHLHNNGQSLVTGQGCLGKEEWGFRWPLGSRKIPKGGRGCVCQTGGQSQRAEENPLS